jgi:DNA-binding transcriptional LysR family regulator
MENFFRDGGFLPRIVLTSSSNETIKQAVMAGMGVALISRHTIQLELRMGLLTTLPVEGLPLMRSWFVAHRRHMPLLPVHTQLRRFLLAEGKSLIDGIEKDYGAMERL